MREIKFRAKNLYEDYLRVNKDDEELTKIGPGQIWVYGGYAEIDGRGFIFPEGKTHFGHGDFWTDDDVLDIPVVDKNTLGQFTGLTDKHGHDIYEGDIVQWTKDNLKYVVKFRSGMFYSSVEELNKGINGGFPLWVLCEEEQPCHIVGNIHDNPSLMKQ